MDRPPTDRWLWSLPPAESRARQLCQICGRAIHLVAPPGLPPWWAHVGEPRGHLARRA